MDGFSYQDEFSRSYCYKGVFFINGQNFFLFYPVFGISVASNTTLKPCANWLSAVISHLSKLSVFHFSKNVKPYSGTTYFVSRLPNVRAASVLCSPTTLKLTPLAVRVLTSSLKTLKTIRNI
jgi:hypothetical protein